MKTLYQKLALEFQDMYYAYATIGIIASSCIGSVAAMLILMSGYGPVEMGQLFVVVAVAMGFNATVLAQLKPKYVFHALFISLLASTTLIVYHLILLYL